MADGTQSAGPGIRIYGGDYRGECRTERCEQIDAMGWLEKNHPERYPLIFHVPNETKANAQHMQMRAKQGVKAGVADIIDFGEVRGAFELKRQDSRKSRLSPQQREFLQSVADSGGFAAVCYGSEEFKRAYVDLLGFVKDRG